MAAGGFNSLICLRRQLQNPSSRPSTIEIIKKELIGRKNAFVALQEYDAATKKVVSTSSPPEFEPLRLIAIDYADNTLTLKLSGRAPPEWIQAFRHPRGGHTSIMGYGPEQFNVRANIMAINVRGGDERLIQQIVDHAKSYVVSANRAYEIQQKDAAEQQQRQQRAALEREIAAAEMRKNVLANVKL